MRGSGKIFRKAQKSKEGKRSIINLGSINILPGNYSWGRILWMERENLLSDTGIHTGMLFT